MMQARASERVRSRVTAFLPTRTSYRLGRKDATTATYAPSGAKAEAILASLLRRSSSFMAVSLYVLSIDPQERVLLGPEGKGDELVGDSREARKRQCAVDEVGLRLLRIRNRSTITGERNAERQSRDTCAWLMPNMSPISCLFLYVPDESISIIFRARARRTMIGTFSGLTRLPSSSLAINIFRSATDRRSLGLASSTIPSPSARPSKQVSQRLCRCE